VKYAVYKRANVCPYNEQWHRRTCCAFIASPLQGVSDGLQVAICLSGNLVGSTYGFVLHQWGLLLAVSSVYCLKESGRMVMRNVWIGRLMYGHACTYGSKA
jgi:hypothetical protein